MIYDEPHIEEDKIEYETENGNPYSTRRSVSKIPRPFERQPR